MYNKMSYFKCHRTRYSYTTDIVLQRFICHDKILLAWYRLVVLLDSQSNKPRLNQTMGVSFKETLEDIL